MGRSGKNVFASLYAVAIFFFFFLLGTTRTWAFNVALHAQGKYGDHRWVAGSEVTTNGIKRAYETLASSGLLADVDQEDVHVRIFAPFSYDYLEGTRWDLVLVEGYAPSVPEFIYVVRRDNPKAIVLHYFLDTYESLGAVRLDVDGFLTNSANVAPMLEEIAPTAVVPLAADPHHAMKPSASVNPQYAHNIVYLGQYKDTKYELEALLRNVAPLGLAIYGNAWDTLGPPELRPYWKGVLPFQDIADLYSSAKVVLGTTELDQRNLGMVNNRVFEALAIGACFLGDDFPEQRALFGDAMAYFSRGGSEETFQTAKKLVDECVPVGSIQQTNERLTSRRRRLIMEEHTYGHRVPQIHAHYRRVLEIRETTPRPQKPLLAVIWAEGDYVDLGAKEREKLLEYFRVEDIVIPRDSDSVTSPRPLEEYRAMLLRASCGDDRADRFARHHLEDATFNTSNATTIALMHKPSEKACEDPLFYDVVFCEAGERCNSWSRHPHGWEKHPQVRPLQDYALNILQAMHVNVKSRASIRIIEPNENVRANPEELVAVRVEINKFQIPRDGMWCLRVQHVEMHCFGDQDQTSAEIKIPETFYSSDGSARLTAVLRTHMRRTVSRASDHVFLKARDGDASIRRNNPHDDPHHIEYYERQEL